jgi:hypothetical protein
MKKWAQDYWSAVHPFNLPGAYLNFMMDDEGEARVKAAYGGNYDRLAALKKKYDPASRRLQRAAAYRSRDAAMTAAFEQGLDLHKLTAARMTGKRLEEVTDEERKGAKAVNFGAIYGQGAAGLVQSAWAQWGLVLDLTEAKAWLKTFDDTYYGFAQWRRDHYRRCEERLRIVIGKDADREIGRIYPKSRVPEGESFYTRCCNLPVQGACADASMLALVRESQRAISAWPLSSAGESRQNTAAFDCGRGQSKPCWTPFPISTIIVSRTGVGPWTLGLGYEASDSANTRRISGTTRSMRMCCRS